MACFPFVAMSLNIDKEVVPITYNLMWPIKDINAEDYVTRNFLLGTDEKNYKSMAGIWEETDVKIFETALENFNQIMEDKKLKQNEILCKYNFGSTDKLPKVEFSKDNTKFRIASDYKYFRENVKDSRYEIVQDADNADMCWFNDNISNYLVGSAAEIILSKMRNQFELDNVFLNKEKFAENVQNILGHTKWIPLTFNLTTQMNEFVGEWLKNETYGESNWWMSKPIGQEKSLDMAIHNSLDL